jgi:HD-like signal output (HDOD) protein
MNLPATTVKTRSTMPRDVAGWVAAWRDAEIPVLEASAQQLEMLRAVEDDVDARLLADTFALDPLMSLKVLTHVSQKHGRRLVTDAETITAALLVLGVGPFFRAFGAQDTVESRLALMPEALLGLRRVLTRARRAASFALAFAVHRMDHDAAVIHEAALLHDFAEMLLWCHAPELALEIARMQQQDPSLRSSQAQTLVLNVELAEVQQALMKAWRLPELLVQISDDHHAESPQVRNVLLAIRVARHSALGWDNPALPDDIHDIGRLLNLDDAPTRRLLLDLDQ